MDALKNLLLFIFEVCMVIGGAIVAMVMMFVKLIFGMVFLMTRMY